MRAIITCPDPENPVFVAGTNGYEIQCSGTATPALEAVFYGLGSLQWEDVSLLIGALLLSCTIATGYNILANAFGRR